MKRYSVMGGILKSNKWREREKTRRRERGGWSVTFLGKFPPRSPTTLPNHHRGGSLFSLYFPLIIVIIMGDNYHFTP